MGSESGLSLPVESVAVIAFVIAAGGVDLLHNRVPNLLALLGVVVGFAVAFVVAGLSGVMPAFGGMALGMALLLPFYAIGAMGAGDVKLMGAVGVFLGPAGVLSAAVLSFLAGGVLAVGVALHRGSLGRSLANIRTMLFGALVGASATRRVEIVAPVASAGKLPYGVAIAAGTLLHVVLQQLGISIV